MHPAISPTRQYVAVCAKPSLDGHDFSEVFTLPPELENNSQNAATYFATRIRRVATVDGCFSREDLQGLKPMLNHCLHKAVEVSESGSAHCSICQRDLGWSCPNSSDKICHYFSEEDGTICLLDGGNAPLPDGHRSDCESEDSCIYCGNPVERK